MNLTRRLLSILIVVVVLFGGFVFKPAPVKAIKNFTVDVTPKVVGEVAEYKFQFTVEKELQVHDRIWLIFPSGVEVPEIPDWKDTKNRDRVQEMLENIVVNGHEYFACGGLPSITRLPDGSVELSITSIYQYIPGNNEREKVEISFKPKFGIINPSKAGSYIFQVKTNRELTFVESYPVDIKEQEVKSYSIDVTPKLTNTIADYTFQLTFIGTLKPGQHKGFYFPPGTTLNPPMPEEETAKKARLKDIADAFSFGDRKSLGSEGYGLPIVEYNEDGYLNIRISGGAGGLLIPDVPNGKTITMHFSKKAGICTPSKPGSYVYKFKTMLFPTMESQPIEITAKEKNNLFVEVSPAIIGSIAEYMFQFSIEKALDVHQYINMIFPKGTAITPPLPEDEQKRIERLEEIRFSIRFCQNEPDPCPGLPIIKVTDDGSLSIQFNTWTEFDPKVEGKNQICITIAKEAGITNPSQPGSYIYKITTQADYHKTYESQPVEITEKDQDEKPDLPDTFIANLWFSNPTKGEVTNMLVHIPLEATNLCCFELMLDIPSDILDITTYFSQEAMKKEKTFDFIDEHVFINGKSLKESKTSTALIGLTKEGNRFYFQAVPGEKNIKELNILFDKSLDIKFLKEGLLKINFSTIFVKADGIKLGAKHIRLLFPDNYIFPEENK